MAATCLALNKDTEVYFAELHKKPESLWGFVREKRARFGGPMPRNGLRVSEGPGGS